MGKQHEKRRCHTCGQLGHLTRDCATTRCHYCGAYGHIARACTLGKTSRREDSFIFCDAPVAGASRCFSRRFVVPLHRAGAGVDLEDLRAGRVDVGCRCASAAFFRSQSLRHNTELRLCFGDERTVCVSGALVRNLTPDERCIAARLHLALGSDGDAEGAGQGDGADLRGLRGDPGGSAVAI